MLTKEQAHQLAAQWIQAWNSHDLNEILAHYAEDVVLVSSIVVKLLNDPLGTVRGKAALRKYFKKGLDVYPNLNQLPGMP
jgi:ketosteroid isomerase-like protein